LLSWLLQKVAKEASLPFTLFSLLTTSELRFIQKSELQTLSTYNDYIPFIANPIPNSSCGGGRRNAAGGSHAPWLAVSVVGERIMNYLIVDYEP
jgi:hypothetical protein